MLSTGPTPTSFIELHETVLFEQTRANAFNGIFYSNLPMYLQLARGISLVVGMDFVSLRLNYVTLEMTAETEKMKYDYAVRQP